MADSFNKFIQIHERKIIGKDLRKMRNNIISTMEKVSDTISEDDKYEFSEILATLIEKCDDVERVVDKAMLDIE